MDNQAPSISKVEAELLLRQINPHWIKRGRLSVEAFNPSQAQSYKLSVDDGDSVSAKDAYEHHKSKRRSTIGVVAATKGEAASGGLSAAAAAVAGWPHHATLDFGALSRSERRCAAEVLVSAAVHRGWIHNPHGHPEIAPG